MDSAIWNNALKLLRFDNGIDSVTYESIISKMTVAFCDNEVIVLAARDEFSLNLVKGQKLSKIIIAAIRAANEDRPVSVKFVLAGDDNAVRASVNSEKKVARAEISDPSSFGLSNEYTFANFVVGDCNRFAHASAVAVSQNPGQRQRNPFYLWGNSGLGKTHLMKAIGNAIIERVIYMTCEAFTNAYIACINSKNYEPFRAKYRGVDVLLIDDIQFLIGKESVQQEFFNTFEALISAGKQIVITCDRAPSNLTTLDNIMFDVQPPDFETRKAIFISKLKEDSFTLSDEIIDYVCENITDNIRQLNGAYKTISSYVTLANGELSLEEIQKILKPMLSPNEKKHLTPEIIINAVAKYYDLTPDKLTSKLRSAEISNARNVAMYICRDYLELKLAKIGEIFGGRSHTTVMHGCSNVDENEELKKQAEEIIKLIT